MQLDYNTFFRLATFAESRIFDDNNSPMFTAITFREPLKRLKKKKKKKKKRLYKYNVHAITDKNIDKFQNKKIC